MAQPTGRGRGLGRNNGGGRGLGRNGGRGLGRNNANGRGNQGACGGTRRMDGSGGGIGNVGTPRQPLKK